jgi:hypothetical protein
LNEVFYIIQEEFHLNPTVAAEFNSEEDAKMHLEFLKRFWLESNYNFYIIKKDDLNRRNEHD